MRRVMSPPPQGGAALDYARARQAMADGMRRRARMWQLLLVVPFVGTLWVPFYDSAEPRLGGVPYFYWYQFLWIGIGALLTAVVYFATREAGPGA